MRLPGQETDFTHTPGLRREDGRFRLAYDLDRSSSAEGMLAALAPTTSRCAWCAEKFSGTAEEAVEWSKQHRLSHRKAGTARA